MVGEFYIMSYYLVNRPEPNMLKILPIIPSSTSQKITHYSYFILKSLSIPIIPTLFSCFIVTSSDIQRNKELIYILL